MLHGGEGLDELGKILGTTCFPTVCLSTPPHPLKSSFPYLLAWKMSYFGVHSGVNIE